MDTAERIKDLAESHIRTKGYNAFSFREIANEMGIKSASIHYHFPTKADLGAAVARRYTERFFTELNADAEQVAKPQAAIRRFIDSFRYALMTNQGMCLCGMLGAERDALPENVVAEIGKFFTESLRWLTQLFQQDGSSEVEARQQAAYLLSMLEGALIVARTLGDSSVFEAATDRYWAKQRDDDSAE